MSKLLTEQAGDGDDSGKRRYDLTREQMRFAEVLGEMLAEVREREQQLPEKPASAMNVMIDWRDQPIIAGMPAQYGKMP